MVRRRTSIAIHHDDQKPALDWQQTTPHYAGLHRKAALSGGSGSVAARRRSDTRVCTIHMVRQHVKRMTMTDMVASVIAEGSLNLESQALEDRNAARLFL